jgi:hypothetical protein
MEIWWSQIEFTSDAIADPVNGYLRPSNRKLMPWNFQIQYSYLHSNVIMCIATLLTRWRKRTSAKILKISHAISTWHWYRENYTIKSTINAVESFKYNTVFSILMQSCALPHYWQDDVSDNGLKFSWYFNRGIDTLKITALSNPKPGIFKQLR